MDDMRLIRLQTIRRCEKLRMIGCLVQDSEEGKDHLTVPGSPSKLFRPVFQELIDHKSS